MQKTKAIVILVVASVLLVAIAGIAYAQVVSAQGNSTVTPSPTPATGANGYAHPQQGYCYPFGQQYGSAYGCRMGMCNRAW